MDSGRNVLSRSPFVSCRFADPPVVRVIAAEAPHLQYDPTVDRRRSSVVRHSAPPMPQPIRVLLSEAGGFEMVAEAGVRSEMGVPNVAFQP